MKIMIEKKDMLETDIDSFPVNLLLVSITSARQPQNIS